MASNPAPKPTPFQRRGVRQVCGWPTRTGRSVTWWCNLPFGHDDVHLMIDGQGRVRARAEGFRQ